MKFNKDNLNEKLGQITSATGKIATNISGKTKDIITKSKNTVVTTMDVNGDGKVDIEDIIVLGLKTPGISISRKDFLSKELMKKYPKETIDQAIATTPADAGIPPREINLIADNVIQFERTCVTGISAALGTPGGAAMAATIPADIIQYYGYMLRTAQKLMYLYGFPELDTSVEGEKFDSETLNILTVCLGVMYGVAGANNAIKAMAKALACGVEKKLINAALTKGTIYPIVKSVAKWFGVRMTKEVFAGFFKKAIPVVGGVVGGGITYVSFKPCCDKLKASLQDTLLSNPNHQETEDENIIIDAEYCDLNEEEIDIVDFDYYFAQLKSGKLVDETCFYFIDDPEETEHYIGYDPEFENPYWSGYCDIPDGADYKTAEELINAPIWDGKSLKERWENVRICHIEGISLNEWLKQKRNH